MRLSVVLASAVLLLSTGMAQAQQDRENQGRGARPTPQRSAPAARSFQAPRAQPHIQRAPHMAQPRAHQAPRMAQPRAHQAPRMAVPRNNSRSLRANRTQQPTISRERTRANRQAVERRRVPRQQEVARPRDTNRGAPNVSAQRPSDRNATNRSRGNVQTVRNPQELRSARQRLTANQLTRLRTSLHAPRQHRLRHVRFAHRIGSRLPRSVRLYAIPAAAIGVLPAYTYYRYTYIDDTPYIVDPDTYEIVDVLDQGPAPTYAGGGGPAVAHLELTAEERALILDSIGPDFPSTRVRIDLALGAELPQAVELHEFPTVVLDRIPRLETLRFVVAGDRIVIVDPRERAVLLVLNR